jgi:hypothetical protein
VRQMLMISGLTSILMTGAAAAPTFAQSEGTQSEVTQSVGTRSAGQPAPPAGLPAGPQAGAQPVLQAGGERGMQPGMGRSDDASCSGGYEGVAGHGGPAFGPRPPMGPPPMRPGMPIAANAGLALAEKLATAETYIGILPDQLGAWRSYTTALIAFSEPPAFDHPGEGKQPEKSMLPGEAMADGLLAAADKAKTLKAAIDGLKASLKPEQLQRFAEMSPGLGAFGPMGGPMSGPDMEPHAHNWGHARPHGPMPGAFFGRPPGPPPSDGDDRENGPEHGAPDFSNPDHG